jgi:A/G-specific adenine glycosylase
MELGATVCLPDNPQCLLCPMLSLCGAAAKGHQDRYPQSVKIEKTLEVPMAALLVRTGEKVLVRKRPKGERWLQGLWEFPSAEGKTFEEALRKLERSVKTRASRKEFHSVKHQITRHKIQLKVFPASITRGSKVPTGFRWVEAKALSALPFSSAQSKVRDLVLERLRERIPVNRPT